MATSASTSLQRLAGELKSLQNEPVEGFVVTLPEEDNLYCWQVAIFGPPDTPYQGGYFKVSPSVISCVFVFLFLLFRFVVLNVELVTHLLEKNSFFLIFP